jgi:hypothetical protein
MSIPKKRTVQTENALEKYCGRALLSDCQILNRVVEYKLYTYLKQITPIDS